jgi:hypothetical protein
VTALTADLMITQAKWTRKALPLGPNQTVYKGGSACADTGNHYMVKGVSGNANLILLGVFAGDYVNASTVNTMLADVDFLQEKTVLYRANGNGITMASNFFGLAYALDDQTVTSSSGGNSSVGRIVDVDAVLGVGFFPGATS